jgi:hypothetical protein
MAVAVVKSGSLISVGPTLAETPLSADGKQFLLTADPQSVMYIFTASGFSVQFLRLSSASTEDIKTNDMCRREILQ